jgi:hypothetical protein
MGVYTAYNLSVGVRAPPAYSKLLERYCPSSGRLTVAILINLMPAPAIRSPHEAPKVSIDPEPVHPPLYLPPETHSTSPCSKVYKQ